MRFAKHHPIRPRWLILLDANYDVVTARCTHLLYSSQWQPRISKHVRAPWTRTCKRLPVGDFLSLAILYKLLNSLPTISHCYVQANDLQLCRSKFSHKETSCNVFIRCPDLLQNSAVSVSNPPFKVTYERFVSSSLDSLSWTACRKEFLLQLHDSTFVRKLLLLRAETCRRHESLSDYMWRRRIVLRANV